MTIALKLLAGTVIVLLRLVRAVFGLGVIFTGLTFCLVAAGAMPQPGSRFVYSGLALVGLGMLVGLFLGLGWLINRIHRGAYGTPHPAFDQKRWSL